MPNNQIKEEKITSQQFEEPLLLVQNKSMQNKFAVAAIAINEYANLVDIGGDTTLRVTQVLFGKGFSSIFGPGHALANGIGIGATLIGSMPAVAKAFNKNEVNSLEELAQILNKELKTQYDLTIESSRKELEKIFNDDLKNTERNFNIEAKIVVNTKKTSVRRIKNFLRKEEQQETHYEMQYVFAGYLGCLLGAGKSKKLDKNYKDFNFNNLLEELFDIDAIHAISETEKQGVNPLVFETDFFYKDSLGKLLRKIDGRYNYHKHDLLKVVADVIKKINSGSREELAKLNDDEYARLAAFAKIAPAYFDDNGKIDRNITLNQSRENVIKKFNSLSFYQIVTNAWTIFNNAAFGFWLGFEPPNLARNQDDTRQWPLGQQFFPIAVAGFFAGINASISGINFLRNKIDAKKELAADTQAPEKLNLYVNSKLKHKQLERFFLSKIKESEEGRTEEIYVNPLSKAEKAVIQGKINQLAVDFRLLNSTSIIPKEIPVKPNKKGIWSRFTTFYLSEVNSVREHVELLEEQIDKHQKFSKGTAGATRVMGTGIQISFMQWFTGAVAYAGLLLARAKITAKKVGAFFNDGPVGATFSAAGFIFGMLTGGLYFAWQDLKTLKKERETLTKKYQASQAKIDELSKRESLNEELENLIKKKGLELPKLVYPHADRNFRKLTTEEEPASTTAKKIANRTALTVAKIGTGILIFRLLPRTLIGMFASLGVLKLIGLAAVGAAVAAFTWPVVVAAIGVGLIWGGIYTYKYIKESQYKVTSRFLDDIDNRLLCARNNTEILAKRLGGEDPTQSENNEPINGDENTKIQKPAINAEKVERLSPRKFKPTVVNKTITAGSAENAGKCGLFSKKSTDTNKHNLDTLYAAMGLSSLTPTPKK